MMVQRHITMTRAVAVSRASFRSNRLKGFFHPREMGGPSSSKPPMRANRAQSKAAGRSMVLSHDGHGSVQYAIEDPRRDATPARTPIKRDLLIRAASIPVTSIGRPRMIAA